MIDIALIFPSAIRIMIPLFLAALGIVLAARCGITHMSMEGAVLGSAFVATWADYVWNDPWLGMLGGIFFGVIYSLFLAFLIVQCRGNHVVAGLGMNFVSTGFTIVLMNSIFGGKGASPSVEKLPSFELGIFGHQSIVIFITVLATVLVIFLLRRTNLGLRINAVGENTSAADSLGIRVDRLKYIVMMLSGVLAGIAGTELSIGQMGFFAEAMTANMGFLAFSAVVFGGYSPIGTILTTFFIAFLDALQMRLQVFTSIPSEFLLTIPYVVTIAALAVATSSKKPSMLGKIYERDKAS